MIRIDVTLNTHARTHTHTLEWDGSVCSPPISELTHANLRRQRDREQGKWRHGGERHQRMAGGKKTRKRKGGGALRMGD